MQLGFPIFVKKLFIGRQKQTKDCCFFGTPPVSSELRLFCETKKQSEFFSFVTKMRIIWFRETKMIIILFRETKMVIILFANQQ
jgi:hypothetical protein